MELRATARSLFAGFALPNGEFSESQFLPSQLQKGLNHYASRPRSPFSNRTKALIPITGLAGLVLALVMNLGVAPLPANADNCQVGSSSSCPATSPQEIFNLYGTTTNGVYWLRVSGVAKEVFVVMDRSTSWGGGSWILLMKGARGTANFGYSNANFTSNTTVLNESSPANNNTSDAKYAAYNSTPLAQIMAVISNPFSGSISNQGDITNNSFGGHTWVETAGGSTAFTRLTTNTSLNSPSNSIAFSSVPVQKYRHTSSTGSTQVFSYQTGTGIYGHNVNCGTGYKARWGILWNNETENTVSCDAYVGIGGANGASDLSPRDLVSYKDGLTSVMPTSNDWGLGEFAFQIWGKMAEPSAAVLAAPAAPTVANAALGEVNVSWTAPAGSPTDYVVQYKLNSVLSWGTNPIQSVVVTGTSTRITGLLNSTSYDFRVMARTSNNSSSPSAFTSWSIEPKTISFNANSGTGSISSVTLASGVNTTLPSNTFTRDRFTFRGWNTLANGTGTNYTNQQTISTAIDLTLYAMWTAIDDRAWAKSNASQNFASRTADVIPVAQDSAWSIDAWVNMDELREDGRWYGLFSQVTSSDSSNDGFELFLRNDFIYISSASGSINIVTPVPKNSWVHIAWTWSANDVTHLYVDGVQVYYNAAFPRTVSAGSFFTLGGVRRTTEAYEFLGHLDQVKVWNGELSAADVQTSMHTYGASGISGKTLRAHYDFNEFNSGTVLDKSGNGYHLSFNQAISGSYSESDFTSSKIMETGTAFNNSQTWVKFNRSYLTASGGWARPTNVSNVKAAVVGGGGGGGAWVGSGGGAGGLIQSQQLALTDSVVRIQVGQPGASAKWSSANQTYILNGVFRHATNGQDSILGSTTTAKGGGRGASHWPNSDAYGITELQARPAVGGSGGGGSGGGGNAIWTNISTGAQGTTGQGNKGGNGSTSTWLGGGGGGAGGAAQDVVSSPTSGGVGVEVNLTGSSVFLAGGGGGGNHNANVHAAGGNGGGGAGGIIATSGSPNTGGGGGGGATGNNADSSGGSGGSGVVILSYGATMEVTQTPGGARAGSTFQRPITVQLKNVDGTNYTGADQQVTITAASSTVLQQTIGASSTNITSTTTTSRNGVATFNNIGFQSGVGGSAQTLTVTANAFLGTSLSVTPTFVAATVNINSTGPTTGSFIDGVFQSSTGTTATILNSDLVSAMTQRSIVVESTGDINVVNGFTSPTAGSDITLKAGGSVTISASQRIQTNGGDVIIWSDSDVSGGGVIRLLNSSEICTVSGTAGPSGTCSTITSGGGDIVLGGGAASTADSSRPGGFAAGFGTTSNNSGTTTTTGVQIGTQQQAGQGSRLYSAGGQISIKGAGTTANTTDRPTGIDFLAASVINSGAGQIQIEAEYRSPNTGQRTIEFSAWGGGTTTIASTSPSSSAVVIRSSSATGAAAGNMGITANTTVFNVTGGLVFEAERIDSGVLFSFNVSGPLVFRPFGTTLLGGSAETSFTLPSSISFTSNPSSITVGSSTNSSPIIISENLQTTSGNIELLTSGAISKTTTTLTAANEVLINSRSGAVSTGSGVVSATSVRIEAGTTVAIEGNITAGTSGTLVRSGGRITGSAGASAASPLLLSSRGGPITLWTTGSAGGVAFGNFTQINTTQSSASGADVTIGGGSALTADTSRPSAAASSSANHGVSLGTSSAASGFVLRSGTGRVWISGSYTGASQFSGVHIPSGHSIIGHSLRLEGSTTYAGLNYNASGLGSGWEAGQASLIEATGANSDGITLIGSSASDGGLILSPSNATSARFTLRASGLNSPINVTGTSSHATATLAGIVMLAVRFETNNGPVQINSGLKSLNLSASDRVSSYAPVLGATGGNIQITTGNYLALGPLDVTTTGTVSLVPSGSAFSAAQTFPPTSSTFSVGNLIVGTSNNTADLTVAAAVTSASEVTYRGGSIAVNANVRSDNGAVAFVSTVASKTYTTTNSPTITAAQGVTISSTGTSSTVSTGTGAISAGSVRISSASTMTSATPITSRGAVEISSSAGNTTVSGGVSAAGDISIVGGDVAVNAAQTTTNSRNITINPRTAYTGTGTLNSAGTLTISGGTSITPTGNLSASGNMNLSGSGQVSLTSITAASNAGNISILAGPISGDALTIDRTTLSTTTGRIDLKATSTSGRGVRLAGATNLTSPARIQTTSGDIQIIGETSSGWAVQIDYNVDITTATGDIAIDSGARGIAPGVDGTTTIGATASGSSSADVTILADRYWWGDSVTSSTVFKTSGNVILESKANAFWGGRTAGSTVEINKHTFSGNASLRIGNSTNNLAMSLTNGSINIVGNYTIYGSAITQNTAVTTSAGSILIDPTTTYVGSGALTANAGNVTISTGSSVGPTAAIQASGNITLSGTGAITNITGATLTSTGGDVSLTSSASTVTITKAVSATNIRVDSSGAVVTGTERIAASQDIQIESAGVNMPVTTGSGVLSAGRDIYVVASGDTTFGSSTTANRFVSIDSGGTTALNNNISSGTQGILVKSVERITTSAGTGASTTRTMSSSGGDITFWTTGANGGVTISNWGLIESNGGDITIGGGAAATADTSRPASNSTSNSTSAVILGTSNVENIVRIRSGSGDITIRGQGTRANNLDSGVGMMAGVKIIGGNVSIYGKNQATSTANNTSAGVFFYEISGTARTLIEATNASSNQNKIETLSVVGETVAGDFAVMLGNSDSAGSLADQITLRSTGNLAGMRIDGTSGKLSGNGVWMAGAVMSTANGDVLLDGNSKEVTLSRLGATRKVTYVPVVGQPGGDITIRSSGTDLVNNSQGFLEIETAGTLSFVPPSGQSFGSNQTFPFSSSIIDVGGLIVGSETNTVALTAGSPVTSAGNITYSGGSFTQASSSATLSATSSGSTIRLLADTSIALSAAVRASNNGIVVLEPRVSGTGIRVGGSNASTMLLTATELQTHLSATTLRLGDRDRTGNVFINSNLNLTGKAQNLAIRSNANVSAGSTVVITVANLGIYAGGTINFPGTGGAASVIALNAGGVTFNQSANYSVAFVDGIDPEFGLGTKFVLSNVDRTNTVDRFMAVTFNPPPAVVIQDKFNNPLASNNLSASAYVVRASMTVSRTDSGAPVLENGTATRSGSTHTFTTLRVNSGTGAVTITYTAATTSGTALVDASTNQSSTSINYLIRAGEPASIDLVFSSTTTRAGLTGLSPMATLKDSTGGTLTTGDYKNATITVTMTGTSNRIISGATSPTTDGVARFPNLIVAGTAATNGYTLTFAVTFRDSANVTQTVSRSQVISITAGTATTLAINSTSQTVTNRAALSDIALTVLDDYGNTAAFGAPASVATTVSAGASLGLTPTLSGTTTRNTDSNTSVATFSGLTLSGKVDTYTLTFASSGLASTTHTVRVTHGAASAVTISAPSTAANDRNFGSNVVVDIVDLDGNVVTSGAQSTQTITLDANTTLTGTRAMSATAGRATFTNLRMLGLVGTKSLEASIGVPSPISNTANIVLGFGDATRVALTRQISGTVNRADFSIQPVITVQDSSGNAVTDYSQQITATAVAVAPASAALTGTTVRSVTSGVTTFTNLRLDGKIGQYDLTFSSGSLSSTTQRVSLTHGAVSAVVLTGATTASNARTFDSSVTVEIQDADQNRVTTGTAANQSIVMSATGATISGTTTRSASSGIATFNDLVLTGSAGSKTLTATILDPSSRTGTRAIELAHGVATQLVVVSSSTTSVNRTNFASQPVISVRDVSGNPVSSFVGRVDVAVSSAGSNVAVLTGTVFRDLSSSPTATFTDLRLNGEVGNYTLTFTSTTAGISSAAQSMALTPGAVDNLELVVQANAANATVISDVVVRVRDANNNVITGNTSSIVLTVSNATISGTATRSAVAGEATFPGLAIVGTTGPKTLTATMTSPASLITTAPIQLTFGTATKLAVTTVATGAVNRQTFTTQPTVTVQDVSGNPVTSFSGDVSVAVTPLGAAISGTTTRTLTGFATAGFTGLGLNGTAGDYTLTFTSSGLTTTSQTIRLTHGAAASLSLTGATTAANDRTFGSAVVVEILDQDLNVVSTGAQSTQTISVSVAEATLTGTRAISATAGRASFGSLKLVGTVGTKVLTASIASPSEITKVRNIALGFGDATRLVLSTEASGFVNRVNFSTQPAITAQDSSGNTVTSFSQQVSVTATRVGGSGSGSITGTLTRSPGSGVATFTNLRLDGTVGQYDLTFGATGVSSTTQRVTLTHGAATAVVLTGVTTASNARTIATNVVAEIQDADANRVTTGSDSSQSVVMTASGAVLSGTDMVNASAGVATFSNLTLTGTAGTKTLTATILSPSQIVGTRSIELAHGEATQLVLTTSATGAVNRAAFSTQPVISVRDVSGNPVSDFVGRVSVAVSSAGSNSATLSGTTYRDLSGSPTATFTGIGLGGTLGSYTLTYSAAGLTGATQNIDLAHGTATTLELIAPSTADNARVISSDVVVRLKDADGNLVTTGTPEVTLSISGATISGTAVRNLASGEVNFPGLKFIGTTGSKTLSATMTSPVSLNTATPVQLSFGDATKLVVTTQASGAVNRQLFNTQPAVTVQDVSGNPVTSFSGTINLSVSPADAALSGTTSRVLSGSAVAYFDDLALNGKIGSYTLTFESTGLTADSQSISVEHGAATSLTLSVPASAVNNVGITDVVVRVLDQDLNLVTTGTPAISLAGSSSELTGTLVRNASQGVATFPGLKFIGEIGNKNVTATAASLSLTSMTSTVSLTYGAATQMVLITAASGAVNRMTFATAAVVTLKDISGNTVIDSSATVTVSESSNAVALSGTADRTPTNGIVSFSALGLNGTIGSYTLTYSSAGLTDITQTIDLTHGAATKIDVVTTAATSRSGQVFGTQPAVRILDVDNNLVSTGASSTATITASLTGVSDPAPVAMNGTVAVAAVGGELTFIGLGLTGTADNYTIQYSSPGLAFADQSIALLAGTPTTINIITGPSDAIAGAGFGSAVSVELRDAANNRVLSDSTTDITATLVSSSDVSTRASSTTTVRVTNGIATFTGLTYTLAGDHKISFAAGALSQTSSSFTITHAIASKFTILTQPAAMRNDIVVGVAPALRIFDAYDNPVLSGATVDVTATVVGSNSSDISAISGNTTSSIANTNLVGLSDLKLKGKVSNYVIRFTGSVSGTSFFIDSDPTALTFGTPTQLVLTQSAAGARAGLAFDTQPQLAIRDNSDNLVADSTLRVTATVTGRSLVGTSAVSASSGIVSFTGSGLGIAGEAATGLVIRYATQTLTGSTLEVSQNIDLTPGAAVKLSIIQQPATVLTRLEFANNVSVQLRDQYDNPVPSDSTSDVSIQLFKGLSPALATGGSTLTLTAKRASSGVATFNGLTLPVEPAADYFLKFTIGSFTVVSSQFEVLPGAVSSMAITQQPSTVVGAGLSRTGDLIAVQPQVTLYDADGYIARGASGNVTVAISSGVGGNLTEGTITAAVTSGVARFEGVRLVGTPAQQSVAATDYRLRFSFTNEVSTVITSPESNILKVTNAAASKLLISRSAASGDAGRDFRTQPIVHIVDRYNNIVETGSDANLLVIASSPTADSLSDNQVNAASGVATFEDLAMGGQVNTNYSIVFEVENRGDITSVTQSNVQIGFGLANKLRIVTQPASLSGSDLTKSGGTLPTQPAVEILDSFNNRVTNSNRQISITLTREGAALDVKDRLIGGVATPSSGVATFSGVGVVGRPGDTYKLAFSATGLTGVTSAGLVVRHGDPTTLEIVDQPVSILGGVLTKTGSLLAGQPKLRLLDFDGNIATEISGVSISASVIRGGGSTSTEVDSNNVPKNTVNFVNGVATFTNLAVIATPGIEQALRFETVVRGATLQSPESAGISFTHGDAHQLAISTQPCAGAGVSAVCETGITGEDLTVQPVIEVQDRYGNRVLNFSGEITVSTTANRGQLSDRDLITVNQITATASSGVATFTGLNLVATPGDQVQLLFTSGSLNSVTSNAIKVRAAAATSIAVVTEPVGARTGAVLAIDPVIELRDRFGNLAASDNVSRITLTSSSGTLTGTTTATATAGRVTFSGLSYTGVPGLYSTLTFTGVNGANVALTGISSSGFTVKNALANTAVITQQPTATATGALLGEAVIALRDFDNNLAEDDSATVVRVEIAAGDGLARFVNESDQTIVDSATSTILRQSASGGVVRFNGLRLVGTPGVSYQLIFTANPDNSAASYATLASNALVLTHAEPASLSVTTNPIANLTNTALTTQPALRVLDRYGNLATSNNSMVVSATLFESTGGVVRSGGSATASGGIVTFSGLTVQGTPGALYKLRFTAGSITVDDTIGFRLRKNADIALTYDPVSFSPSGSVTRSVVTDSPGVPVYSTTSVSSICTVNSSTGAVSVVGVGDCMVNVRIPDTTYYIGGSVNSLLVINKAEQASISVTSSASVPYLQTRQLTASGGSGTGALVFSATGNCRVVDSILIPGEVSSSSTCRVRVEREEDSNYNLKVSSWQTITVTKINQASLAIGNSSALSVGDVSLFTHGGSGTGAVTYVVDPDDNAADCRIISTTVLRAGADGTCSVTATKAASTNFNAAPSALKTFTFQKAAQTVYFTSTIPERPLAGGDLYEPVAASSSGLTVTYSITSGNNTICRFDSVQTRKVQFLTSGNCEITATQAGDSQYVSARAKQVIAVGLRNQSITFMPLEDQRYGQPAFMLTATASSGLAVSFQIDSAVSSQACRVTTAGLVSIDSAGTCAIKASQPGNSTFQAAPDVTQKFTVTPDRAGAPHLVSVSASDQTITATFTAPSYLGGSNITRYRMEVSEVGSTNKYVNFACQANPLVPCQVSGLPNANNESYTVRVAAVTAAGIGAYSRSSDPLSTAVASAAVSNLTASASSTRLDLVWEEPIAIPGTFQSYQVFVWPMNDSLVPSTPTITVTDASANGTSITVSSPSGGGQSLRRSVSSVVRSDAYNIRVVTITNRIAVAQPTNTSIGMKIGATTPGSPDEVELNELSEKIIIGWSAPTFDGGHPVLGYIVKVNGEIACDLETQGGQQVCEDSDQRIFEWSELNVGSNYLFEIAAVNLLGVGSMASDTHSIPAPAAAGSGRSSVPGVPAAPGPVKPSKPGSDTSGPDVLNPDTWNPSAPGAESPGVEPGAPAEPKPETNASGEQNGVFDPSWLLWLLLFISGGGGLSLLARHRRRKLRHSEGVFYPSPIAESTQFKDG